MEITLSLWKLIGASRASVRGKTHSRKTDHAAVVNIPLLILEQAPARFGNRLQECINGSRATPIEIVVVFLHQIPESPGIAVLHVLDALAVAQLDSLHDVLAGASIDRVAVAASHVRHVHAKHPQELVTL